MRTSASIGHSLNANMTMTTRLATGTKSSAAYQPEYPALRAMRT